MLCGVQASVAKERRAGMNSIFPLVRGIQILDSGADSRVENRVTEVESRSCDGTLPYEEYSITGALKKLRRVEPWRSTALRAWVLIAPGI